MNHANSTIKALEKSVKGLEKEIHNQKKTSESCRDALKKLKSDHSSLKISKAKLETNNRKLEKLLSQKDSKNVKLNEKVLLDPNKNYLKDAATSSSSLISYP